MSDKTSDKLLPCPFCGGNNVGVWRNRPISPLIADSYVVICYDCHFGMCPTSEKGKAIAAWNTRKSTEQIVERLEDYRDDFMEDIYEELRDDSDNLRANRIIERFDNAIEIVKEELDAK